jgi:putative ABC transport system permease protein
MTLWTRIRSWFRATFMRSSMETEMDAELRFHLDTYTEDLVRTGIPRQEALRRARLEFGGLERAKEECRDARGVNHLEALVQDLRYGVRMLRKNPGFTAVAVLTLALGIGANTAIFSIVNGVLLQPLPYPHSEQLVVVARTAPMFDHPVPVSGPNFLDWRARAKEFQSLAGFDGRGFTVMLGNEPEHVLGAAVSYNFMQVLQVTPAFGRDFLEQEEHTGNDHVALVTNGFWKQRLGGSPDAVGRTVILNGQSFTLVGVLPTDFRYALMQSAQVFIPLNVDKTSRGENFMSVVGRLKPSVSLRQAQSEMDSIAHALEKEYPADNAEQGAVVIPMLSRVGSSTRDALLIMLAAVGLVLLIACANIGNLTLAQAVRRQGELTVRRALGAGTSRLALQCLTESVLLGFLGGALGLALGYWGLLAFRALSPDNIPRLEEVQINVRVLLFASGISIGASILFGLAPAFRISRMNLADTLKEGSTRATSGAERGLARQAFVVAEIALSLVLLTCAGLAIRSFMKLISTDPGYDAHNLLTFYLSPQVRKAAQAAEFYRQVMERVGAIPGVLSVAMSHSIPPGGGEVDGPVITSEHPDIDPNRAPDIIFNPITPGYFHTMRLRLLGGREFSSADVPGASLAVILNEAAASALFPGKNAVGQRIKLGVDSLASWWTVVGVVTNERYFAWDSDRTPTAYLPFLEVLQFLGDEAPDYDSAIIVRTAGEPLSFLPAVRSVTASIDNQMALLGPESMEQRLSGSFAPHRFNMALLAAFAGLALLLAAVGIYGVMAQFVAQRTHEIGIRMALGAGRLEVVRLVLGQGMRLALLGSGIGIAVATAATRLIHSLLYGVSSADPVAFASGASLLIGIIFLACYIPARRAMRVDPMVALRYE